MAVAMRAEKQNTLLPMYKTPQKNGQSKSGQSQTSKPSSKGKTSKSSGKGKALAPLLPLYNKPDVKKNSGKQPAGASSHLKQSRPPPTKVKKSNSNRASTLNAASTLASKSQWKTKEASTKPSTSKSPANSNKKSKSNRKSKVTNPNVSNTLLMSKNAKSKSKSKPEGSKQKPEQKSKQKSKQYTPKPRKAKSNTASSSTSNAASKKKEATLSSPRRMSTVSSTSTEASTAPKKGLVEKSQDWINKHPIITAGAAVCGAATTAVSFTNNLKHLVTKRELRNVEEQFLLKRAQCVNFIAAVCYPWAKRHDNNIPNYEVLNRIMPVIIERLLWPVLQFGPHRISSEARQRGQLPAWLQLRRWIALFWPSIPPCMPHNHLYQKAAVSSSCQHLDQKSNASSVDGHELWAKSNNTANIHRRRRAQMFPDWLHERVWTDIKYPLIEYNTRARLNHGTATTIVESNYFRLETPRFGTLAEPLHDRE
ncbi:hypothetical protein FISHEDRAFT_59291 [Fistulina hepatica ATCC 64428]|uniref:Uncharacterized protein n=1 Tax=Fistulina hepatica ATCC 64428 TaxID=1128425 RepID=A0A0D7AD58_9AGAR|nr:hypothetical protein FISHEDRAFT_59291 [Fistulina hepatica ATCC 64428]